MRPIAGAPKPPAIRPIQGRSSGLDRPPPPVNDEDDLDDDATSVMARPPVEIEHPFTPSPVIPPPRTRPRRDPVPAAAPDSDRDRFEGTVVMRDAPARFPPPPAKAAPAPAAGRREASHPAQGRPRTEPSPAHGRPWTEAFPERRSSRPAAPGSRPPDPSVPPLDELIESPSYRTGLPRTPIGKGGSSGGAARSPSGRAPTAEEAAALLARPPPVTHRLGQPQPPPPARNPASENTVTFAGPPATAPLPPLQANAPRWPASAPPAPFIPPPHTAPVSPPMGHELVGRSRPPSAMPPNVRSRPPSAAPAAAIPSAAPLPLAPPEPPPGALGYVLFAAPLALATAVVAALALS